MNEFAETIEWCKKHGRLTPEQYRVVKYPTMKKPGNVRLRCKECLNGYQRAWVERHGGWKIVKKLESKRKRV